MSVRHVIVVDDEPLARQILREYLEAFPEVKIVAECENGFEAVKAVAQNSPDLIFLDVQMPKLNGFEVLELLDPVPAVIFTTAYDQYALQAFEVHAIDYLLKPFSQERLSEALNKAWNQNQEAVREEQQSADVGRKLLASSRGEGNSLERVLVREKTQIHVIPVDQIDYIEAKDDYVNIVTRKGHHLKKEKLSHLEKQLDASRFVRIHRSYILNIERLSQVELYAKDSRMAILNNDQRLPVSRSGYGRLKKFL